jgi:translation initiation factor IF-2
MSDKIRVYEIAEESGATSSEVALKALDLGFELKSAQSAVSCEDAEEILNYILTGKSKLLKSVKKPKKAVKKVKQTPKVEPEPETEDKEEQPKTKEPKKTEQKETPKQVKEESEAKKEQSLEKKAVVKEITPEVEEKVEVEKTKAPKEQQKEGTKDRIALKRRGISFVKKKRPAIQNTEPEESLPKKQMKSLSEILGGTPEIKDDYKPKAKKEKKKIQAKAYEHGKVIEMDQGNNDFGTSDDFYGEEVVLLDMDLNEPAVEVEEPQNKKQNKTSRSSKPSEFGNRPQGLRRGKRKKRARITKEEVEITEITIPEDIRVYEFAEKIGKNTAEVIGKLFVLGMMVTKNDFLENDEIEILAEEFGIEVTIKDTLEDVNYLESYEEDGVEESTNEIIRPPVITIMGHVDHGKTSLLDKIRDSGVALGEAGGITQHIGAYTIDKNGQKITFVDTPGHEAFSSMRARGASVTDIVIIVVAADDGVKPQTLEAISHAKASKAPIIVAVNKIDKPAANIDMVKSGMAEHEMTPTDWGGEYDFIPVSAHTGEGIDELLDTILLQAEVLELKADPTAKSKSVVVESSLEKGRGAVATVIVQNGTLKVGDNVVVDTLYGRVKAINNDKGQRVNELGLSETGQVLGLSGVPEAGSVMVTQNSEKEAKEIADKRAEHARHKELSKSTKVTIDELSGLIAEGKIKALPVIIKADVGGSLEAIKGSLEKIKNDEVKVNVIHSGVGGITESDLSLASASSNCIILGFNVRPTGTVKSKAKADGIEIKTYSVIYDLIDDVKELLSGMMSSIVLEENTGQAEVRDTFVVPKIGTVAGCYVTDGTVVRGGKARLIRDGVVVYTGTINSLKRFKDDVKDVSKGYECGIMFDNYNDIKVGDFIETFIQIEEKASIE